ncbi:MAG: type VI secretion system baseplate subunit TssE [Pseudomonas sp.]
MPQVKNPSLHEMLTQHFDGGLKIDHVDEASQRVISVLDNVQRILNSRAGQLAHLPDYGLPDMSEILQGLPATAHRLSVTLEHTLLRFEPRLKRMTVTLLPETVSARLRYALDAELRGVGMVRFGTEFVAQGKVLVRHLKKQEWMES